MQARVRKMPEIKLDRLIAKPFYSVHQAVKAEQYSEIWLKGGRGSTKSSFISVEIILGLLRDVAANAIIYRKVAQTLRESVYTQMLWAIDQLGVSSYFRAKVSPLEITYIPTGQRIVFRGADDPRKSKSIKLRQGYFKYLWFEELSEFSGMDDVRTIKASIIRGGGKALALYSYNPPESQRNWVNAEARVVRSDRLTHHSSYLDVPPEWLGESFITEARMLEQNNERVYRHMYLGEATGTGSNVFVNIVIGEVTDAQIMTLGACYDGLDFGWYPDPVHWGRCAYMPAQKRLVIFDEYRAWRQSNYDLFVHLTRTKGVTAASEVIADSAEPKSIADLRSYGLRIVGATKGPGSVNARMKWLQSLREIVIDPVRCPHTAQEFQEYEYARARSGEVISGYPDANNHAIDMVGYATNRIWLTKGL